MIFTISYYSHNKGTTDYFLEQLSQNKIPYLYLRHPFPEDNKLVQSQLLASGQIIQEYRSVSFFPLEMLRVLVLNVYATLRHFRTIDKIVAFGSINCVSVLLLAKIMRKELIFWGVDYSRRRFGNKILNKIYLITETLGCRYADIVLQPTQSQEAARIRYHGLQPSKSRIVPNGVNSNLQEIPPSNSHRQTALIYIGAITPQHGVIEFIQKNYIESEPLHELYIFGDGPDLSALKMLIRKHALQTKIKVFGARQPEEISNILISIPKKLVGIAPYTRSSQDHVEYGDSLKIKEYLAVGMPFLTSDVVPINPKLRNFGLIYNNDDELARHLQNLDRYQHTSRANEVKNLFSWDNVMRSLIGDKFIRNRE